MCWAPVLGAPSLSLYFSLAYSQISEHANSIETEVGRGAGCVCVCVCRRGARSLSQNGRSMLVGTLGTPVICQNHNLAALVGSRRAARSSGSSVRSGGLYCAALVASMRGRPCAAAACSSAANILAASAASVGAAAAGSGWFCVVSRVLLLRPGPHSYWGRRGAGVCLWGGVELPEARSPTVFAVLARRRLP